MQKIEKKEVSDVHLHIKKVGKRKHYNFLFRGKYKKLTILLISIIAAYMIFTNSKIQLILPSEAGFFSIFLAGIIFAFGFLAPFATGFFIALDPSSIITVSLIASLGTLISDMFIFKFIKLSFLDEFIYLRESPIIKEINSIIDKSFLHKIKAYIYYSFIGFMIASPLPDELGVSMLAGMTRIKSWVLAILSYVLHFIGFIILFSI